MLWYTCNQFQGLCYKTRQIIIRWHLVSFPWILLMCHYLVQIDIKYLLITLIACIYLIKVT